MRDVEDKTFVKKEDYLCFWCNGPIKKAAEDIAERADTCVTSDEDDDGFFVLCTKCINKIFIFAH